MHEGRSVLRYVDNPNVMLGGGAPPIDLVVIIVHATTSRKKHLVSGQKVVITGLPCHPF
jgi:hypothetical protein